MCKPSLVPQPHPLSKPIWDLYYAGYYLEIAQEIATELQLLDTSFHTNKPVKDFVADLYQQMYETDEVEIKLFGECHRIN